MRLFRPFWIRNPDSLTGCTKECLLRHLFVCSEVPDFLFREWQDVGASLSKQFVWSLWFIVIGQGVMLARVFSKHGTKYDQFLVQIPADFPERDGRYDSAASFAMAAQARRLGASDATVLLLAGKPAFRVSPLEMPPALRELFEGECILFAFRETNSSLRRTFSRGF